MIKTHTFFDEHALKAVELNPNGVLVLTVQKSKKTYKCIYLDMIFKVGNITSKGCWFKVHDITLISGVLDSVNAIAKYTKGDPEKSRLVLTSSVSNSGAFGQFLQKFGPIFIAEINRLNASKEILVGKRTINAFVQDHVADESSNVDARGQEIEDPIVRLIIDFDKPNDWTRKGFPWGKTVTQFFDYTSAYLDADGKHQYKSATVKNEDTGELELVDATNIHLYATSGCIIREAVVYMANPSLSSGYVSSKIILTNCIFEQSHEEGLDVAEPIFENEEVTPPITVPTIATQVVSAPLNTPLSTPLSTTSTEPMAKVVTTTMAANTDAVDDLINSAMIDMGI